ncbi:MAG: HD domain-containing protein [Tissierellia bacterium]|nr:HD domain-containing protein [Tissierellia bacterium]
MNPYEKRFRILNKYMNKIADWRPPMDEYIELMSKLCKEMMEVDICIFWILDDVKERIYAHESSGLDYEISGYKGIIGHVIKSGQARLVARNKEDPYYDDEIDKILGFESKSSIYIPLKHSNNDCYGAIHIVDRDKEFSFDEAELEMMVFIGLYIEETLTSYVFEDELIASQNDIIFLLAELGEKRSYETSMHVRRVSFMAEKLAKLAKLPQRDVSLIKMASPLHDIGKVGIEDAVLNKPGKLTDEEYARMKEHSAIGHTILSPIRRKLLKAADTIAHQHHERYDGRGYPNGLEGEEIHIYARITTVCDVFDALANERPYKKAWEKERVIEEFKNQRGKQFDPLLTDLFLENIDEFYKILEKYKDVN